MRDSNRTIIKMQWVVIAVLVLGAGIGGFMLVGKVNDLSDTNSQLTGDNLSLQNQLSQAKAQNPSTSPSPSASATPTATPTPTASVTPTPSTPPSGSNR